MKGNSGTRSVDKTHVRKRLFEVKNYNRAELRSITTEDLDLLNGIFSDAYLKAGVEPDSERIEINSVGLHLIDRKNLEFIVEYDPTDDSMKHDLFLIHNEEMRGKGLSKKVYGALLPIYEKLGIKKIRIHAGDENGGYTWARYGFRASRGEASSVIGRIKDDVLAEKAEAIFDEFYSSHPYSTKFPMHLISDKPWGKDALKGSKWFGELDLSDKEQKNRYVSYIRRK